MSIVFTINDYVNVVRKDMKMKCFYNRKSKTPKAGQGGGSR